MFGRRGSSTPDRPRARKQDQAMEVPQADPAARHRLGRGVTAVSTWTLRLIIIAAGLWVLAWLIGEFWSILLPLFLALLLSTVLWPPVRFLRRWLPASLAALIGVVGLLLIVAGVVTLITRVVTAQGQDLANQFSAGLSSLQDWLAGPPFNLNDNALGDLVNQGVQWVQANTQTVAGTALSSLATVGSILITLVLALVLAFFMLKDGPRFVPWLRRWIGREAGDHFAEVSGRVWSALGAYIWSQAAVAAVDGIFIGLGLWILGVPLALPIAVLTFFGGFIPIVGAFVAGVVAVLVALVTQGFWSAVIALGIVLLVQQLEGNVLQPLLVSRTLKINAAVVLGSVSLGGTLFGIIGAFLSVPAVAVVMVVAQYLRSQVTQNREESERFPELPEEIPSDRKAQQNNEDSETQYLGDVVGERRPDRSPDDRR
ncbi:AI-2E family transporter [Nakamurella sp. YIM 132084]|uniref:AI-2E family transporter n=2 Tax=Nakamurella leprariae TaxID=2803911 RepID=A0A939BWW2_9ACTN|nr:AI-2E family transporter [Nakamurella leprariae]